MRLLSQLVGIDRALAELSCPLRSGMFGEGRAFASRCDNHEARQLDGMLSAALFETQHGRSSLMMEHHGCVMCIGDTACPDAPCRSF